MSSKSILVTGASSDIGILLTQSLLKKGYRVTGHYGSNAAGLKKLESPQLCLVQADLTNFEQAKSLVEKSIEHWGSLDGLVNMIGPLEFKDLLDVTPERWRQMIELNLNVAFTMTHYAQSALIASKGNVINFAYAGVEDVRAWRMATSYAAAKAGIAILTKSFASALAVKGVRVNAVAPGYIDFGAFSKEDTAQILKQMPQGRMGQPGEVVDVVHWLLDGSPSYVNGAIIPVAGAWEHAVE